MARLKLNPMSGGLRGRIGDLIFRRVNGKTIVTSYSEKAQKPSAAQLKSREKFQAASRYAQSVARDLSLMEEYLAIAKHKKLYSAHVAASVDYLSKIKLEAIRILPVPDDKKAMFSIKLVDNYKGKSMHVTISNKDGTLIERGEASFTFGDSFWIYNSTTLQVIPNDLNFKLVVTDRMGNVSSFEDRLRA